MMKCLVLLLLAPIPPWTESFAQQPAAQDTTPLYTNVTLCGLSFHGEKANPRYVSLDAEFVIALPHGMYLRDPRCPKKTLGFDFPDAPVDPSIAELRKHFFEFTKATGTFRGILKRDSSTRIYLWLQSTVNFEPENYVPGLSKEKPIEMPEQSLPDWPAGR